MSSRYLHFDLRNETTDTVASNVGGRFYPVIGIGEANVEVTVNFGPENLRFDLSTLEADPKLDDPSADPQPDLEADSDISEAKVASVAHNDANWEADESNESGHSAESRMDRTM